MASKVRMLRPSRPMMRPFMSSAGSGTTETVVSDTTSAARRWMAVARMRRPRRSASSRALISRSRTSTMASRLASSSTFSQQFLLGRPRIEPGDPFEVGPGLFLGDSATAVGPRRAARSLSSISSSRCARLAARCSRVASRWASRSSSEVISIATVLEGRVLTLAVRLGHWHALPRRPARGPAAPRAGTDRGSPPPRMTPHGCGARWSSRPAKNPISPTIRLTRAMVTQSMSAPFPGPKTHTCRATLARHTHGLTTRTNGVSYSLQHAPGRLS